MNKDYYAALLIKVRLVVVEERRSKHVKETLFLQDNAPVNTARVARRARARTGFQDINYLLCRLGLSLSNYFLFLKIRALRAEIFKWRQNEDG